MITEAGRRNVVREVRRLALALTSAERLTAHCEFINWGMYLDEWESALAPSHRWWYWDCYTPDAAVALRALVEALERATERRRGGSVARFIASTRFEGVSLAAQAFVDALDAEPHPKPRGQR